MIRAPALALAIAALAVAAPCGAAAATRGLGPQVLRLYEAPADGSAAAAARARERSEEYAARLGSGRYGPPEDFAGRVRIRFPGTPRTVVGDSRAFSVEGAAAPSAQWREEGHLQRWQVAAGSERELRSLRLAFLGAGAPLDLDDYDEIWIDYSTPSPLPACAPGLALEALFPPPAGGAGTRRVAAATRAPPAGPPELLAAVDATGARWKEKDYAYLAGRIVGLPPDGDWRYAQSGKNAVVQRRLHVRVDNVQSLEIALAPGTEIDRVNLLVGRKDNYREGELVEFVGLRPDVALAGGRRGVRLDLTDALANRFPAERADNEAHPGQRPLYLQEIVVFIPGRGPAVAAARPVTGMAFIGVRDGERPRPADPARALLPSEREDVGAGRERIRVGLRGFATQRGVALRSAQLTLAPPAGVDACAVRIESVQAVSGYADAMPAFARDVEAWSRRLGGVFAASVPRHDAVDDPGIVAYFPFAALGFAPPEDATPFRMRGPSDKPLATDERRLAASTGAAMSVDGPLPHASVAGDFLVLEGRAAPIDVSWPLAATLGEGAWFDLAMDGDEAADVRLVLERADGGRIERAVTPNRPLRLALGTVSLRAARLRIVPSAPEYRLKLREMAFLEPAARSYMRSFAVALPARVSLAPTPVVRGGARGGVETGPGRIAGELPAREPLDFSTSFAPELAWVGSLRVRYEVPAAYASATTCALTLRFHWSAGTTERRICLASPQGTLAIDPGSIAEAKRPGGALRSIDWTLEGGAPDAAGPRSFALGIDVEGWSFASAASRVRASPLLTAGSRPVFAAPGALERDLPDRYTGALDVDLESDAVPRLVAAGGRLAAPAEGLFRLERVVAAPRHPIDWDLWTELVDVPPPRAPPARPTWLAWLGLLLLAGALWKNDWRLPPRMAGALRRAVETTRAGTLRLLAAVPWPARARTLGSRHPRLAAACAWAALAIALFGAGMRASVGFGQGDLAIAGGLAAAFAMRAAVLALEERARARFPAAAERVYGTPGGAWLASVLALLIAVALALAAHLPLVAEQLAIVAYYALAIGVARQAAALRAARPRGES